MIAVFDHYQFDRTRRLPRDPLGVLPRDQAVLLAGDEIERALDLPRDAVHRPSIDAFFQSVTHLWRGDAVGVLLTGMGRDGAIGLRALRMKGHHTIAQDEATSAVYGMPKAAVSVDAAVEILPADRIASRLMARWRN